MTDSKITPSSAQLEAVRKSAQRFAKKHVAELATELLEWSNTSILRNGRVRELAHILKALDTTHALKIAENFAVHAALEVAAKSNKS